MGGRIGTKITPRGTIGKQTFAQVQQLTAHGAMTRLAAFKQIAEASGRQVGTVSANYYYVARQQGVPLRSRRSRRPRSAASGVSRISDMVQMVQQLLQRQAEEIQRLWKETAQFAKVRRLLRL